MHDCGLMMLLGWKLTVPWRDGGTKACARSTPLAKPEIQAMQTHRQKYNDCALQSSQAENIGCMIQRDSRRCWHAAVMIPVEGKGKVSFVTMVISTGFLDNNMWRSWIGLQCGQHGRTLLLYSRICAQNGNFVDPKEDCAR